MLRIYNAAGAPGEFLLLTSIEKRQVIYLSKLFTQLVKLLDEACYCQANCMGDNYKFLLSQSVQ